MKEKKIKAAAIQMESALGNVTVNLQKADLLVEEAFSNGADLVVLPEFFTSAVAFHPSILDAALPFRGKAFKLLTEKAKKYQGMVGGSYISVTENNERYNTFVIALPDGSYRSHNKDLPTMWENCYYLPGNDDGVVETPVGDLGLVVCWEFVRTQTAKRLLGNVDVVVGGSCWWDVPYKKFPVPFKKIISRGNRKILHETFPAMARMVGAPVIHAGHASYFKGQTPMMPGVPYYSRLLGESQIVDASGNIMERMKFEDGEGIIYADVNIGRVTPSLPIPDRFWIPNFHPLIKFSWHYQNFHGKRYYKRVTSKYKA